MKGTDGMRSAQGSGWGPPPGGPHGGGFTPPPGPGSPSGPAGWGPPPPGHAPPVPQPPIYGSPPGAYPPAQDQTLHTVAMVLGILAIVGMCVGFIPCLGWLNWINIPFSLIPLVIGIVGLTRSDPNKVGSIVGTICGALAMILGFVRLVLGAGML